MFSQVFTKFRRCRTKAAGQGVVILVIPIPDEDLAPGSAHSRSNPRWPHTPQSILPQEIIPAKQNPCAELLVCPAAVGRKHWIPESVPSAHSPFQSPGSSVGVSQSRGDLEGGEEEMRIPLAHTGEELALQAGGDVGYLIPFYSMDCTDIFSFILCAENSVQLLNIPLIWLIKLCI